MTTVIMMVVAEWMAGALTLYGAEALHSLYGAGLANQAPGFDPGAMFTNLIKTIAGIAVPIGAFVLVLMIVTELFNDRRDMRKIILEGVGIVVLVIIMLNPVGILNWLMSAAGSSTP